MLLNRRRKNCARGEVEEKEDSRRSIENIHKYQDRISKRGGEKGLEPKFDDGFFFFFYFVQIGHVVYFFRFGVLRN